MRRSLVDLVPQEILSRRTKQFGARTPILALEKHWDELNGLFQDSIARDLKYINPARLLEAIGGLTSGKELVSLVRLYKTISLELWLRGLATRNVLNAPRVFCGALQEHVLPTKA